MSWDILLLEEVDRWFQTLDAHSAARVAGAIDLLEQQGPSLGRPTVDKISESRFHNMKELRPAATSIRILFVFDPPTAGRSATGRRQGRRLERLVRQEYSDR